MSIVLSTGSKVICYAAEDDYFIAFCYYCLLSVSVDS